jgi:hypothetical protein
MPAEGIFYEYWFSLEASIMVTHKNTLLMILTGITVFLQCTEKQDQNQQARQPQTKPSAVQKPAALVHGSGN